MQRLYRKAVAGLLICSLTGCASMVTALQDKEGCCRQLRSATLWVIELGFFMSFGPRFMVTYATSPYFSYPREASWANLDDGYVKKSYIVVGVPDAIEGATEKIQQMTLMQIDQKTHVAEEPMGLSRKDIPVSRSTSFHYKIYEAVPGYYSVSGFIPQLLSSNQDVSVRGFWVKPGSLTYIGDLQMNGDKIILRSDFEAVQAYARAYRIAPERLMAVTAFDPLDSVFMQLWDF